MAAALIEMERNCAEGGLYVCREKRAIRLHTLGVQIKHIEGEDLTWGDADWARRDLGEAAATGARPWVSQREIPQLPSKSNQIEEFFIDESIVLDQNSRFGWILLWYRAGHTGRPGACRGRCRRRIGVCGAVFPHYPMEFWNSTGASFYSHGKFRGMPSSHRSSHTGRSAACRGRARRRNGGFWGVFPHNRLDEDEDARVGLWARWFFMPSAAEPAPLDAAICPHALALRGVVRSAGLDLAEAGACEWYRGCLCLLAPCLGPER